MIEWVKAHPWWSGVLGIAGVFVLYRMTKSSSSDTDNTAGPVESATFYQPSAVGGFGGNNWSPNYFPSGIPGISGGQDSGLFSQFVNASGGSTSREPSGPDFVSAEEAKRLIVSSFSARFGRLPTADEWAQLRQRQGYTGGDVRFSQLESALGDVARYSGSLAGGLVSAPIQSQPPESRPQDAPITQTPTAVAQPVQAQPQPIAQVPDSVSRPPYVAPPVVTGPPTTPPVWTPPPVMQNPDQNNWEFWDSVGQRGSGRWKGPAASAPPGVIVFPDFSTGRGGGKPNHRPGGVWKKASGGWKWVQTTAVE